MKKEKGVRVSRDLAITNTTSRQSFKTQLSLFSEYDPEADNKIEELNKSLFTLNEKEAMVFDGLCKLFTDTFGMDHLDLIVKLEKGEERYIPVIERQEQDVTTETHYRTVLSLDETKAMFCGKDYEEKYWDYVLTNIKKLAYEPSKKRRLVLGKKTYIDTEPLRVAPIWEDGSRLRKIANLNPCYNKKHEDERISSKTEKKIAGFVFEFYKPLFSHIIVKNKKNSYGKNFIRQPPYFHLGIIDEMRQVVEEVKQADERIKSALHNAIVGGLRSGVINNGWLTNGNYEFCLRYLQERSTSRLTNVLGISPIEIRNVFYYFATHDNGRGDYITIDDLTDFTSRCFEGLTRKDREGNRRLYPSQFTELIEQKLKPMLLMFKRMALHNKMNGGQLMPYSIVFKDEETGEVFNLETNKLRIKCLKSRSFYSTYTEANMKDDLICLAGTSAKPQMTG